MGHLLAKSSVPGARAVYLVTTATASLISLLDTDNHFWVM